MFQRRPLQRWLLLKLPTSRELAFNYFLPILF